MLFITTRNKNDPQTTRKMLSSDTGSDGGLYIPFQMPAFTEEEIAAFSKKSFGEAVCYVLNHFFGTKLSAADVEFCIGRSPLKLHSMNHRILVAETWRNVSGDYERTERELVRMICSNFGCEGKGTSLLKLVIRLAVLFGIFAELMRTGDVSKEQPVDISVACCDFSAPMAAWYARAMGLPIANIIATCNENSGIWELLHLGELHTDSVLEQTTTPLADFVVPTELERLVHAVSGFEGAAEFADTVRAGRVYRPAEERYAQLKKGMFSAVVSCSRVNALIPSVYRTNSYILGPYTALAYGGMMDYRAKTGETRNCLLIAERSPLCDGKIVADSMDMSLSKITEEVMKA